MAASKDPQLAHRLGEPSGQYRGRGWRTHIVAPDYIRTPARPRLILVDDHRMFVETLSAFLAQEYEIAGVAFSGDELLAMLPQCPAECLLLDLEMPGRNGLELVSGRATPTTLAY